MLQGTALGIGLSILFIISADASIVIICGFMTGSGRFEDCVGHLIIDMNTLVPTFVTIVLAGVVVSALVGVL